MTLNEVFNQSVPGYHDQSKEQTTGYSLRRTRLTLYQISKLRKMNDIRVYEKSEKLKTVQAQYGSAAAPGGESPF